MAIWDHWVHVLLIRDVDQIDEKLLGFSRCQVLLSHAIKVASASWAVYLAVVKLLDQVVVLESYLMVYSR